MKGLTGIHSNEKDQSHMKTSLTEESGASPTDEGAENQPELKKNVQVKLMLIKQ